MTVLKKDGYINKTLWIPIFSSSEDVLLSELEKILIEKKRRGACLVFTPNPEMLVLSSKNKQFKEDLMVADFNVPDGIGLVIGSRLLELFKKGESIRGRITGADLAMNLVSMCSDLKLPVYLLGASEEVNIKAVRSLKARYVDLDVHGNSEPRNFDEASDKEWQKIIEDINRIQPGLLLVGYGQVKQERFLVKYRDQLKVGVAMGVGGTFDFWAGKVRRAPLLIRKVGLEWLWRLVVEPWRASRIYRATVEFGLLTTKRLFT